jgi:FMN phosphatase YigB (HAD superfamily)
MEIEQENLNSNPSRLCLVTPCLNAAAYLEQTIRSVLDQPGAERVDYIVMDGGSSDGTMEILERHKSRFHHFESAPDEGLYHAIEEGFRRSDSEIMGWINADDMLCPWTLRLVLRIFDQLPEVSFITSRFPLIADQEGVVYRSDQLPGVTKADFFAGLTLPGQGRSALNFISQESTFWRRSLWNKAGARFDHGLRLACDFELWSRFLEITELHVVDSPMAMFRVHGKNLSIERSGEYRSEAKSVLVRQERRASCTEAFRRERVKNLFLQSHGFRVEAAAPSDSPSFVFFDESSGRHMAGRERRRDGESDESQGMCLFEPVPVGEDFIKQILGHAPELVCFDVFDTLLWRPYRRPVDVFHRLGEVCRKKGFFSGIAPAEFAKLRTEAESMVRFSGRNLEVTHVEIVRGFCGLLGHSDSAALAEAEFALERESLFAYPEMFKLLNHLHREGIPYALCSDMYFSASQIRALLERAAKHLGEELPEPCAILVSGEMRTGKSDRLFDLLIEKTGIPAHRIVHIGDNPVSDVLKPRAKGIHAIHLPRTCEEAEAVLDAEERYHLQESCAAQDFGLSSTRKEMLAESLAANDRSLTHHAYGAFVAGPVFASFAAWLVLECQRQNIRRVDCILREGHFLSRLLDQTKGILGVGLEVGTVLASRFCLRAAALLGASEDDLVHFLRNVREVDVQADLFEYIGLFNKNETAVWLSKKMDTADWSHRVEYALRVFRKNPHAVERVSTLAGERKQGLLAYLASRQFPPDQDLTLVDLGWGGTIQSCLLPFLRELGFRGAVRGLYLGTDHRIERLSPAECPWRSLLYLAGRPTEAARLVQRTPELLEQFCMSPHGSLLEFQPDGMPKFHENRLEARQIEETANLQAGILDFSARWLPRFLQSGGDAAAIEALAPRLRAIISRSIDAPRPEEVALFQDWRHDSNNGSEDCRNILGDPATLERVRSGAVTDPSELDWLHSYWPQGLFVHLGKTIPLNQARRGTLRRLLDSLLRTFPCLLPVKKVGVRLWFKIRPRLSGARFQFRMFQIRLRAGFLKKR